MELFSKPTVARSTIQQLQGEQPANHLPLKELELTFAEVTIGLDNRSQDETNHTIVDDEHLSE